MAEGLCSVVMNMIGFSAAMLLSTIWWQKVDFPMSGGPTSRVKLSSCTSANGDPLFSISYLLLSLLPI
jgi:hypothetical protein